MIKSVTDVTIRRKKNVLTGQDGFEISMAYKSGGGVSVFLNHETVGDVDLRVKRHKRRLVQLAEDKLYSQGLHVVLPQDVFEYQSNIDRRNLNENVDG
jgi:hypothetical protein